MYDKSTILKLVANEFAVKAKHFAVREFAMNELHGVEFDKTKDAGVYVFWHQKHGFVKVGKSQSNASKRAMEHIRDNTTTKDGAVQMRDLKGDAGCKLIILNIDEHTNMHWLLALENFLERELKPCIRSVRNG